MLVLLKLKWTADSSTFSCPNWLLIKLLCVSGIWTRFTWQCGLVIYFYILFPNDVLKMSLSSKVTKNNHISTFNNLMLSLNPWYTIVKFYDNATLIVFCNWLKIVHAIVFSWLLNILEIDVAKNMIMLFENITTGKLTQRLRNKTHISTEFGGAITKPLNGCCLDQIWGEELQQQPHQCSFNGFWMNLQKTIICYSQTFFID